MQMTECFARIGINCTETGWVDDPTFTPRERQVDRADHVLLNARNDDETQAATTVLACLEKTA